MKIERVQPPQSIVQRKTIVEREYRFKSFGESIAFVNTVAETADVLELYPEFEIRNNVVTLCMISTDENDLNAIEVRVTQAYSSEA